MADQFTLAKQCVASGRYADASTVLGDASGRSPAQIDALRVLIGARVGRYVQSRELAIKLAESRHTNPLERSICEYSVGLIDWDEGFTDRAIARLQKSVLLAKQADDLERLCWSQLCLWGMLASRHEIEIANPLFSEVRSNVTRLGNVHVLAQLHIYVAEAEGKQGLITSANVQAQTAINLLKDEPNFWLEAWAEHIQLALSLISSDVHGGLLHGKRALMLAKTAGVATTYRACLGNYGNLLYMTGEFDEAVEYFREAIDVLSVSGENSRGAMETIAAIRLTQGRTSETAELLDRLEASVHNPKDRSQYVSRHTQLLRVRLLMQQSDWKRALTQVNDLINISQSAEDRLLEAMALLCRAEILLRLDSLFESMKTVNKIVPHLASLPPQVYGRYEAFLASALLMSRNSDGALRHFRRAETVFTSIQSAPDVLELRRAFDHLSAQNEFGDSISLSDGRVSLQNVAAVMLHAGRPGLLAREILHLLRDLDCVTYAALIATSPSADDTIVEAIGTQSHAASEIVPIGSEGNQSLRIVIQGRPDAESLATINSLGILLHAATTLESARRERENGMKLWTSDEEANPQVGNAIITGKMRDLMDVARKVAKTRIGVLLTGESGTGKEILAKAIHHYSPRAERPFVPFNCTAVPREMLESQLFGHRRGAFTSADRDNPGLIRTARGGTLFLDEIGELGLDLQPKLLRFLESGEISPLGEPSSQIVDVRIIAATNRNLEQLVQQGQFREDLFYRLNVVPLAIPPLRERRDEIPALVHHFVAQAAVEFSKGRLRMSEEAMEHFFLFPWPGNIRQLQNEVRRIVALADPNSTLTPSAVSQEIRRVTSRASSRSNGDHEIAVPLTDKLMPTLARVEREMIRVALGAHRGRLDAAAKALGISRKGLYLKRQRLGL